MLIQVAPAKRGQGFGNLSPFTAVYPRNIPKPIPPTNLGALTKVSATDPTSFQNAMNAAVNGQVIVCPNNPGWTQTFNVPNRGLTQQVYVVSQAVYDGTAPFMQGRTVGDDRIGFGRCVSGYDGIIVGQPDDRPYLTSIIAPNTDANSLALTFALGAQHWTFAGFDISFAGPEVYNIINNNPSFYSTPADLPAFQQFWWCYIHGSDSQQAHGGFTVSQTDIVFANCEFSQIKTDLGDPFASGDIQAIVSTTVQRMLCYQCRLIAAGENVMIGGGDPNLLSSPRTIAPGMSGWQPSDIEYDRCTFYKPARWFPNGGPLVPTKNLHETKGVVREWIHRCLIHDSPVGGQAQGMEMQNVTQQGWAPWLTNEDVIVEDNIFYNIAQCFAFSARSASAGSGPARLPAVNAKRFIFRNNLCYNIGVDPFYGVGNGTYQGFLSGGDPTDILIEHNTMVGAAAGYKGWFSLGTGGIVYPAASFETAYGFPVGPMGYRQRNTFQYNVADFGQYGGIGAWWEVANETRTLVVQGNGMWIRLAQYGPTGFTSAQLTGTSPLPNYLNNGGLFNVGGAVVNELTGVGFVDPSTNNYRLSGSSPFLAISTPTGQPAGADIDRIMAATAGVV